MSDWALFAASVAALVAVLTLVHRVITQVMGHIDKVRDAIVADLRARFEAQEASRLEASRHWRERFAEHNTACNERHEAHGRRLERLEETAAQMIQDAHRYVTMDRYLESDGRITITLRRIEDALARLPLTPDRDRPHG
jgi:hypothetical protein